MSTHLNEHPMLLSIRLMTYMHAPFIKEAMDGIFNQQTNFVFEVVIGDDFSTDETLSIIKSYHDTDTIKLKILDRKKGDSYHTTRMEKGRLYNFTNILEHCTGKYIAFLDGDDYWVDPLKLQKQVDFLEANPSYNVITGNVKRFEHDRNEFVAHTPKAGYSFGVEDMIVRNQCNTCSTMIRNFDELQNDFELIHDRGTDSQMWIRALGAEGKGKFMEDVLAVYRKHSGGVSSQTQKSQDSYDKRIASMQRKIDKALFWNDYFENKAANSVKAVKRKMYWRMAKTAKQHKKMKDFVTFLYKYNQLKFQ